MTFREKSAVIAVLSLLLTYGAYAWRLKGAPMSMGEALGLLTLVIVAQAAIMVVAHLVVAVVRRPEAPDERDRLAELRGTRNGYWALATGVVAIMGFAIAGAPPLTVLNGLVAALVAAEVMRYVCQLIYYRTGL